MASPQGADGHWSGVCYERHRSGSDSLAVVGVGGGRRGSRIKTTPILSLKPKSASAMLSWGMAIQAEGTA